MPDASDTAVLEIRNLAVRIAGPAGMPRVVEDVSLEVHAGETVCVVGESGSGKSVTALATMGLLPRRALEPAGGSIHLEGEELLQASPARLRALRATSMAMVFQEPMTALNPVATVGRQIEEVLRTHTGLGAAERRGRILEILRQVHLPEVDRIFASYPHQLSGGQRQRIVIAMALVLRPRLLICDEPTTALDVTTQRQILSLIRELQEQQGTAVLFITHDMGVVAEIADRVVVMRRGRLVETGGKQDILRRPAEPYTRELIAAVPSLVPRAPRAPVSAPPVLETVGLGKTYRSRSGLARTREVAAAEGVTLRLAPGRTLGIVGESGSGKSTVARCVMRLIEPSAGEIRIGGTDVAGLSRRQLRPHRRRAQIVFQDPYRSLNPRLRISDTLIEGPMNFGLPRAEALERARRLMPLVGLDATALDRFPHQFSGGQRQRIAIARALAMEPDLLVADEAVSALDVSVQAQVLVLLEEIQERLGIAILFITHDLRVAAQICDEVAVMRQGRVVEIGPAAEVLRRPRDDYTRQLFEAAPGRHWDFANFRPVALEAAAQA
ncbi:ABC transporter ATP-binding protein [Inquilinus limosus]|uniref:ABC transporter ATP-binding protein n=1 Tax=Inquilinus limosus TaxID=171674 RepID=UPI000428C22C|nr:ABC transporter ATP-binding protein [Inquilinus limosus]